MTAAVERRYRMIRLGVGDYLLPSNDARTLWRIHSYEEDGSLVAVLPDGRERTILGTFWAASRYDRAYGSLDDLPDDEDLLDWDRWSMIDSGFGTRRDAVDAALRRSS